LLNLSFMRKRYEKGGIKDPVAHLMEAHKRPDIGISQIFAGGLVGGLPFILLFGLHILFFMFFNEKKLPSFELFIYPLGLYGVISYLISYILLWHKDKYLKYFKEFSRKPRKWKVKWAWISLGVILFPFVVLILSFVVMAI